MFTDYSNIGINLGEDARTDIINFVNANIDLAEFKQNDNGYYAVMNLGDKIELWFYGDQEGVSSLSMEMYHKVRSYNYGQFIEWVREEEGNDSALLQLFMNEGVVEFPLNIEIINPFVLNKENIADENGNVRVVMTFFAKEVSVGEGDFTEPYIGSCIPCGTFPVESNKDTWQPSATAIVSGRVEKANLLENPVTGEKYWSVLLNCLGNYFNMVIAPELLTRDLQEGDALEGLFWISGKVCEA